MITDELYSEAEKIAIDNNAKIITAVLNHTSNDCSNCIYFPNRLQFEYLLKQYTKAKIQLKRIHNRYYGNITPLRHAQLIYWETTCSDLKSQMAMIAPCEECKKKHNPTKRQRKAYSMYESLVLQKRWKSKTPILRKV